MARRKIVPTAFAVVRAPKAPAMVAAEGRIQLMERARKLSDNGEAVLNRLLQIITIGEDDKLAIDAAKLFLSYSHGLPAQAAPELPVHIASDGGMPASSVTLTAEQLEAAALGVPLSSPASSEPHSGDEEEEDAQIDEAESAPGNVENEPH